ncbi:YggT family protein [Phorcysia thermohydrogeniphila]|uniref:YggT family protein n=1 Tax=Phorcysia thermohydrogeniphila TaxID=936138 RepID=A0A4R1G9T2_9BACT|nr:YggT family protein [Phorcysia thermohydrogeniphila]TCK04694.1 YggT family protein [Phorcysia thermohydrogeniphila]
MLVKEILHTAIELLTWLIIIGSLLTWVPPHSRNRIVDSIIELTDGLLEPIRKVVPPIHGIDISPIVAIIILQLLDSLL